MPSFLPILRMPSPLALSFTISASIDGLTRRRPNFTPLALARASPALTRSLMIPRSNSANTPNIWNIALPAVVEVSRPCWCRKRSTPLSWRPWRIVSKSVNERPSRSTDQVATNASILEDLHDLPAGSLRYCLQLAALVVSRLLIGRDPEINGDALHGDLLPKNEHHDIGLY